MKCVAVTGKEQWEMIEVPEPRVKNNFAKVRLEVVPMCTEVNYFRNGEPCSTLGHEGAGEVVEAGERSSVRVGDRVVVMPTWSACGGCERCRQGDAMRCLTPIDPRAASGSETGMFTYAEHCIQQDWLLLPIPADISTEHAAMACCGLGPTFSAAEQLALNARDTVVVGGLGAVGLGAVVNAKHLGARVIAMDPSPYRLRLATALGADLAMDPLHPDAKQTIRDFTGGLGPDKAIETSNVPSSVNFLTETIKAGGSMCLVSWSGSVDVGKIVGRGITVYGAWHWNHLRDARLMMQLIRRQRERLDIQITHRFPLHEVEAAWRLQMDGACGKVMLLP